MFGTAMVTEMTVMGDPVYQCDECAETFETREAAEAHEPNCMGPATM